MPYPAKYPPELRKAAYKLFHEGRPPVEYGEQSRGRYTCKEIGQMIGMHPGMVWMIGRNQR